MSPSHRGAVAAARVLAEPVAVAPEERWFWAGRGVRVAGGPGSEGSVAAPGPAVVAASAPASAGAGAESAARRFASRDPHQCARQTSSAIDATSASSAYSYEAASLNSATAIRSSA